MNSREQIREDVAASLALNTRQAAERHIQRLRDGWDLQFAFWPMNREGISMDEVTSEVASALGFDVVRRNIALQDVAIDACSIGFEQLYDPNQATSQLIRGVGIWFPVVVELPGEIISGSDDA